MTANRIQSSRTHSSVRGTELFFNNLRLTISAIKTWIVISLFVSALCFVSIFYLATTDREKEVVRCAAKTLINPKEKLASCFDNSQVITKAKWTGYASLLMFTITFFSCWRFLRRRGHSVLADRFIRGAKLAGSDELKTELVKSGMAGSFEIAGVPLLKERETEHLVVVGATGSGKSVAIKELLDQVRTKKQRAIIYDVSGEYVSTYFDPKNDVILNPLDARSPAWNLWNEAPNGYTMDSIAASLIPDTRGDDSFWVHSARTLFTGIADQLRQRGENSNERFFYFTAIAPLPELHSFLKGTPAGALMDPASEKTASSIRATLANYLRIWPHLKEVKHGSGFSIRNFITEETGEGCLFITSRADQHDFLKPILSCWLSLSINSTLSLPENGQRRLWFFLDELASLHRIKIGDFLDRARKYGGAAVLGTQSMSQLQSIYGREDASSLLQNCKTGLFLQVSDADTAKATSAMCGNQEIFETGESQSFGRDTHREGSNLSVRRTVRPIVLDAEFLRLQKLEGYLRLPDDWPIAKVKLNIRNRPKVAEAFIARTQTF